MAQQSGFRDVEHLFRPIGLALLVVILFFVARWAFIPEDFGVYGYYRAGALDDVRAQQPRFAGQAACIECHDDAAEARSAGAHVQVGCEACHGALGAHANDPTEVAVERPDPESLCLRCHEDNGYRPDWFPQVEAAEHAMDEACNACHEPHQPGL